MRHGVLVMPTCIPEPIARAVSQAEIECGLLLLYLFDLTVRFHSSRDHNKVSGDTTAMV